MRSENLSSIRELKSLFNYPRERSNIIDAYILFIQVVDSSTTNTVNYNKLESF
jgi:hypothetical protein